MTIAIEGALGIPVNKTSKYESLVVDPSSFVAYSLNLTSCPVNVAAKVKVCWNF